MKIKDLRALLDIYEDEEAEVLFYSQGEYKILTGDDIEFDSEPYDDLPYGLYICEGIGK